MDNIFLTYISCTSIYYLWHFCRFAERSVRYRFQALLGFSLALAQVGITDAIQRFVSEKISATIHDPLHSVLYVVPAILGNAFITLISVWYLHSRDFVH